MAVSNKDMFLWWGSGSSPCWKPMIVLAEKGLWEGCPNKLIEFSKKEHKGDDVLQLNPRGQVPTFKHGDVIVNESSAICMYLEDKFKDINSLIPTESKQVAEMYQRMFEVDNIKGKILEPIMYYKWRTDKTKWDMDLLKERVVLAEEELKRWDGYLTGKDFLVGGKFTMADVFFYPFLATLDRQSCNFSQYPALLKYLNSVGERPSIKATQPPHWKDNPKQTNLEDVGKICEQQSK